MPYIVTTIPQACSEAHGRGEADYCAICGGSDAISRRAVATLGEAWSKLPPGIPDTTLVRERFALEEHGRCSIGPSPDGTVIEAERVRYQDLQGEGALWYFGTDAPESISTYIIDAYNAAQEG